MTIDDYCDELDGLLAAGDETVLTLDEIHGFISAGLCGPRVFSFNECVCALVLPDGGDDEESECELPSRFIELLKVLYEDIQRSIDDGSFLPIVSCEQGDGENVDVDARQWCCGFLMCVESNRADWKLDADRVLELLTPIVLLADEREFDQVAAQLQEIGPDIFRQELLEALPDSVCAFKRLFRKKPQARRPVARPAKKRRDGR